MYLEGNTGAGKSTLAAALQRTGKYDVILEPVHDWQNVEGHNLLALRHQDPQVWAFPFQALVLSSLAALHSRALSRPRPRGRLRVFERSMERCLHVYAEAALQAGALQPAHTAVLRQLHAALRDRSRPRHYIYVRTDPEEAHRRMASRGRPEEQDVPLDYLRRLHDLSDRWLLEQREHPVFVVDGDLPQEEVLRRVTLYMDHIARVNHS
ncbi:hypothetical protein ONE63_002502 [Megalurothrips usitatus]|uniref:Deoxynucleoside kinase domain-containing protein n=1 Tax=Megalurothrips usitatus TaxID=439358 RepID=A0AAV7XEH1_9NEOP|nr:hypothetical protein ONE63_002502 [Megalurothrips usitatus]